MTESVEPRLTAVIPCRGVYQGSEGDVLTEVMWGPQATAYPALHGLLRVYTRWAEGAGEFRLTTFIATDAGEPLPDMSGLPQQASSVLTLTPAADPSQPGGLGTAIHEYHHLVFPEPGRYWVMVVLDNILVAQVPLWALALEEV